jgi:hypothetical protein
MISFFFKRRRRTVDCLTDDPGAFKYHAISPAVDYYPEWWKKMPNYQTVPDKNGLAIDTPTIKRCIGFMNLFRRGVVLPLWSSVAIETNHEGYRYSFAKQHHNKDLPLTDYHPDWQTGPAFTNGLHMKLVSPWFLVQPSYYEYVFQPMTWNTVDQWSHYTVLPGIMDFKYQNSTNVNMFLSKNSKITIEAGTPMYQIIPVTDDEIIFKNHLVDSKEINKIYNSRYGTYANSYRNIKKFYETEKRCPLGFK